MHEAPTSSIREILTNAIRYWESRRLVYNVILVAIVLFHLVTYAFSTLGNTHLASKLCSLFVLWTIANIAYTTAYIVDIPVQLSDFQQTWRARRVLLFSVGLLLSVILTWQVASQLFLSP